MQLENLGKVTKLLQTLLCPLHSPPLPSTNFLTHFSTDFVPSATLFMQLHIFVMVDGILDSTPHYDHKRKHTRLSYLYSKKKKKAVIVASATTKMKTSKQEKNQSKHTEPLFLGFL